MLTHSSLGTAIKYQCETSDLATRTFLKWYAQYLEPQ